MKKVILILTMLLFVGFTVNAQRAITDTLQGAETVAFTVMPGAKTVTATCTQLGGTSDGTLTLYGATTNTGAWVFVNYGSNSLGQASPKASITGADSNQMTITNTLVCSWAVYTGHYDYYKLVGVGTTGDTTKIVINWAK
jgi:hypothetical protein